ncbi:MAG: FkbM family methyltransferase [Magnetococcales bacterium]|nr:FkbM family methyltransferase [Magnetococcales bacterium]
MDNVNIVKISNGIKDFDFFYKQLGSRAVLGHIFSGEPYPVLPFVKKEHVRTIVDIGAHIGEAAFFFHFIYPGANIFSFEPDPESFGLLMRNVGQLGKVRSFHMGCFDCDKEVAFFKSMEFGSVGNSIHIKPNMTPSCMVQLRDTATVLKELAVPQSVDIMKIDTEGCEVAVLNSLVKGGYRSRLVYIEHHSERDCHDIHKILFPTHVLWQSSSIGCDHGVPGELLYIDRQYLSDLATHTDQGG